MTLVAAPLHNVYIHSSLVKGFFKVAVLPALPIKGVDFILSNDLAGGKVKPVPEVIDSPDLSLDAEKSAEVPPEIFPACVVTRAQSKKYGEDLSDSFLATGQFLEDMTVSDRLPEEARSAGAGSPSNSSELVQLPATREEFMAAQFPEAIPLRKITAPVITKALLKFFSMFGLPKVVQTDQGTNFMSKVFARVLDTLGIKHVTSSPYHPESQGALERFHQTMKCMLRKHCHESHKDWDDGVPLVLFAAREAVQESLGFSPAELVFGHEVRGPLRVLKEHLIMPTKTVCSIPGYYRRFCRNFSSVAAPLTTLTSPSKSFVWSGECQQSFESLKGILCCTPVLSAPDFSKPFKLEVDASGVGTGAVLLQEDAQAIDHPVSYFSRKFNKHQLKYSTIEKEALALLFALQHFEVYLGASVKPIKVYTDHNPLVFLSRMYNHNQRLMRWSLIVQNYNLDISHKKGSDNVLADALSRAM
ncbi:uncharacterized protein [Pseudochaenichthys georgianus]|uniref:uncharacterized protein n=1 Tax=Pseudochaenichthys georgianus TaxID=52239 RepID=UPI0039C2E675